MIKNKIITLILVAFATILNAQNTFTSKIVDSENNEVLIGATTVSYTHLPLPTKRIV